MSLVLTNAGEKLEIAATVVIPFVVHYADYVGATPAFTPGVAAGDTINGTKDLLAAPGSGQRVVRTISVHNDSGGADDITIQLDDGGTNYTIVTVTLPDDYTLCYDENGWKTLDDNGALATTVFTHALLGPYHNDATTDAVTRGSIIVGNIVPLWDELVFPGTAYHLQTDATDVGWAQDITMADGKWVGIGAALERIDFNAAGNIRVMGADLGVGVTPLVRLDVEGDAAGSYAGKFFNDGDNVNRHVLVLKGGADNGAAVGTTYYIYAQDGDGDVTGSIRTVDGVFALADASDERRKTKIKNTALVGLDVINGLRVRDYNWKDNPGGPAMTSFVAQEAQGIFPAMIGEASDGTLMTARAMLIPILTKAIQELDARLTQVEIQQEKRK